MFEIEFDSSFVKEIIAENDVITTIGIEHKCLLHQDDTVLVKLWEFDLAHDG